MTPPPPSKPSYALELARLRRRRGLSQAALAKAAHVSPGMVGLIETGQRRGMRDVWLRLADALRLSPEEKTNLLALVGVYDDEGEDIPAGPPFAAAVVGDQLLRSDQKRVLIDLYEVLTGRSAPS